MILFMDSVVTVTVVTSQVQPTTTSLHATAMSQPSSSPSTPLSLPDATNPPNGKINF